MLRNIFWTIIVIMFPIAGIAVITQYVGDIGTAIDEQKWAQLVLAIIMFLLILSPGWFMWKGTKLIPIISNIFVRIITMILFLFLLPFGGELFTSLGYEWGDYLLWSSIAGIAIFSLIGIWLK